VSGALPFLFLLLFPHHLLLLFTRHLKLITSHGRFGDHTKGVYVSKHADYTFWLALSLLASATRFTQHTHGSGCSCVVCCRYQEKADVKAGDKGSVIALTCVTGKRKHFPETQVRSVPPLCSLRAYTRADCTGCYCRRALRRHRASTATRAATTSSSSSLTRSRCAPCSWCTGEQRG
jgi:hypothetical protein